MKDVFDMSRREAKESLALVNFWGGDMDLCQCDILDYIELEWSIIDELRLQNYTTKIINEGIVPIFDRTLYFIDRKYTRDILVYLEDALMMISEKYTESRIVTSNIMSKYNKDDADCLLDATEKSVVDILQNLLTLYHIFSYIQRAPESMYIVVNFNYGDKSNECQND
jgi:hypothetical protein